MAQNRSQQPHVPGPGTLAPRPGTALRFDRAARDTVGRPANDNQPTLGRRLALIAVRTALVGAVAYALWRWIA